MPGAGHIVHMPAHIYYRIGLYKESLEANRRALKVDERYFNGSPSDPIYRYAYYPHNIHFILVSAQMGGDGPTALDAAARLDASLSDAVIARSTTSSPRSGRCWGENLHARCFYAPSLSCSSLWQSPHERMTPVSL